MKRGERLQRLRWDHALWVSERVRVVSVTPTVKVEAGNVAGG